MPQTSYSIDHAAGLAGQLTGLNPKTIDTGLAEGAIAFGRGLIRGTAGTQVLQSAASGTPIGVAVRSHHYPNDQVQDIITGQDVNILRSGTILVEVTVNVARLEAAYMITAAGATNGKFTNVSTNNLLVGKFMKAGTANGLVELQVQL